MSILLVVIHHTMLRIPLQNTCLAAVLPKRLLEALGYNGYEAVFVFFVVSGFLITTNALRRGPSLGRIGMRSFYARRLARIAPCLLVLVAVLSLLTRLRVPNFTILRPDQSLGRAVLSALGMHLNWYEGHTGYLPAGWDVLWSLSIEELFYLGFPLACLLARRRLTPPVVPLCLLALSLPLTRGALAGNEIWQEKAYLPGMAAIATGVLAALYAGRTGRPGTGWMVQMMGCAGTACLLAVLILEDLIWPVLGQATMLILTGGTALLLLAFHWRWLETWTARGTAWVRSCGRLSYEIYLSHIFVLFLCWRRSTAPVATCTSPGCGSSRPSACLGAWAGWSIAFSPRRPTGGYGAISSSRRVRRIRSQRRSGCHDNRACSRWSCLRALFLGCEAATLVCKHMPCSGLHGSSFSTYAPPRRAAHHHPIQPRCPTARPAGPWRTQPGQHH